MSHQRQPLGSASANSGSWAPAEPFGSPAKVFPLLSEGQEAPGEQGQISLDSVARNATAVIEALEAGVSARGASLAFVCPAGARRGSAAPSQLPPPRLTPAAAVCVRAEPG